MATTREQLAQLQRQVHHLQAENAEVRRISERERGIEVLRRAGVIRGLTPEEKKTRGAMGCIVY
jgi:hypothetical protein